MTNRPTPEPADFDPVPIAVRAFTEPCHQPAGSLEWEILGVLTGPDAGFDDRLRRQLDDARTARERSAVRCERAHAQPDADQGRRERLAAGNAKRHLERAEGREQRLGDLGSLTDRERLVMTGDLTRQVINGERDRRAKVLAGRRADDRRPVLFFDTETRITPDQRLMFGVWRLCQWQDDRLVCVQEGIFDADDLTEDEGRTLAEYAKRERMTAGVDRNHPAANPALKVATAQGFVRLLYQCCHKPGPRNAASLVGLNLNFDVSRLAVHWGASRSDKYQNGFSLQIRDGYAQNGMQCENSRLFPRYGAKQLSSTKAMRGFVDWFAGHVLDVRQLMFALTNRGHSLVSGCEAYGVPYAKREVELGQVYADAMTYCREDVEATHRLYEQVMLEYGRHPIPLQASQAYSAASVGKGYLAGMGVIPRRVRQPDFPREHLGIAMSAFYGGRTECKIRKTPVPVVYCDLLSAYPTGNSLMDLWRFVIADRVTLEDCTRDVRRLVADMTLERCLDPTTWTAFPALVQIQPDGDVLPVRGRYTDTNWNIGSNHLHSEKPLWYSLPDIIASRLITGRAPKILRALRLTAHGVQDGLTPISLRSEIDVDPHENFFATVIEQRHRLPDKNGDLGQFLKTLANAASYGVYAEMIRSELGAGDTEPVLVADHTGTTHTLDTHAPERPGSYFFSPIAAAITGATRLLLAITEKLVTDAGGAWAMCDTDSMAIVATEHGGAVPCPGGHDRTPNGQPAITALSWAQVTGICDRMRSLNPYGGVAGTKSILEMESENLDLDTREQRQLYCYSISSKRYCLYNLTADGDPVIRGGTSPDQHPEREMSDRATIRKRSDHGLGYLINPVDPDSGGRDWIAAGWEWIVRDALGLPAPEPEWFDRPAMMRLAITKPRLLTNFNRYNEARPTNRQMRPFNFVMVAGQEKHSLADIDTADDPDLGHEIHGPCSLMAPYESRPDRWTRLEFTNHHQPGSRYRIAVSPTTGCITVRTLRSVFEDYRRHPEPKALGPNGRPCVTDVHVGLLSRRTVHASSVTTIGKEITELDERITGVRQDESELLNTYAGSRAVELVRQVLITINEPVELIAETAGVSTRTVERFRAGHSVGDATAKKLTVHIRKRATRELRAAGVKLRSAGVAPESIFAAYLHHLGRLCACGCGKPVTGRRRYHDQACRQAAHRDRQLVR
jgi:hypothetical protein